MLEGKAEKGSWITFVNYFYLLLFMYVCLLVYMCTMYTQVPTRLDKDIERPRIVVIGGCKLPDMYTRNRAWVSCKDSKWS